MLLFISIILSAYVFSAKAENSDNNYISKEFKVCPFNVDGLPQKFGWINVNPDGKGAEGAKKIGQYISQSDIDIWALSEDFNYHGDLIEGLGESDYQIGTARGGINLKNFKINARFDIDGLNFLCKKPFSFSQESWTKWNDNYGWADHGNDLLITKGFRYYLIDLGDGIYMDVYILHMDADDGEKDNAARASQLTQLREAILAKNDHRPVIVMGDTNCRYTRDDILGLFTNPIIERGSYDVKDAWVELCKDGIYPKVGDAHLMVKELGYLQGEVVDKVIYLNPKDGDTHLSAIHFEVDADMEESDHKPVIVTMRIEKSNTSTGIKGIGVSKENTDAKDKEGNTIKEYDDILDRNGSHEINGIYDLNGNRRKELSKGLNIIRMSDGSTKKIWK